MDYNKIGNFIMTERKAKKLTQAKLAENAVRIGSASEGSSQDISITPSATGAPSVLSESPIKRGKNITTAIATAKNTVMPTNILLVR